MNGLSLAQHGSHQTTAAASCFSSSSYLTPFLTPFLTYQHSEVFGGKMLSRHYCDGMERGSRSEKSGWEFARLEKACSYRQQSRSVYWGANLQLDHPHCIQLSVHQFLLG